MKFSTITTFALSITAASAAGLDVGSVISSFYPKSTPKINGQQSTALASALHSVEATWTDSPAYTSANAAIYSAAPSKVKASISKSGYYYREITSQDWYTKSVPNSVKTAVANEVSAIDSAASKILGTISSTAGGAPMRTAAPVVGAMALMGGMYAAM